MTYYFVDYENVTNNGLVGIELLSKKDLVYILTSENHSTLTWENADKMAYAKYVKEVQIIRFPIDKMNNANKLHDSVDFALMLAVGMVIGRTKAKQVNITIISKDSDFFVLNHIKELIQHFNPTTDFVFVQKESFKDCFEVEEVSEPVVDLSQNEELKKDLEDFSAYINQVFSSKAIPQLDKIMDSIPPLLEKETKRTCWKKFTTVTGQYFAEIDVSKAEKKRLRDGCKPQFEKTFHKYIDRRKVVQQKK